MAKAFLLLGSNSGNKELNLVNAISRLKKNNCSIIQQSSVYESEAWGYHDSENYYNQAIETETNLCPEELLETCLKVEKDLGRVRSTAGYEARTIDIDIIFFENLTIKSARLEIPHPRAHLRKFVLAPLNELCPGFVHPVLKKTINQLLEECTDEGMIKKNLPGSQEGH
ncbi:MAG: 2-amino-4-hydroxy-6-hydroxymethyldihydropteridine diphosphokinase [Bacteroidales bacterium]|nr:2-amino-4-hydroxy-6-hydroxymethyldihydropteridine diphosphokinase [Bacteroidales bacterium]